MGDFDGDGIPEVVFNSTMVGYNRGWSGFPAYLYYGNKNNEYAVDNRVELPTGGGGADYVIADMDLDGYPDLLFVTWDGCRIFRGGPGGPNSNDYIDVFKKSTSFIYNIYVADFNRDGWLDILMVAYSGNDKPETLNNSTFIHFGSPEGFSDENTQLLPTYSMGFAQLADIDNDGWLDIIYGDKRGYIGIYKGGPEGYSTDRLIKIPLDLAGKVPIRNINTADINNDGWLDLVVGLKGHWLRESSGYYILYSDKGNFDQKDAEFHMTEASPGGISFSDLNNDGHLDMMVSAYSTAYTRELPTFIYYGKDGTFDFENPLIFKCNASVAFNTVDITGNGYPDLLIGCHRSDPGHIVESMLYFNGPGGLGKQDPVLIPGMGPHGLSARDFGNAKDRSSKEYYESQVYDISSSVPVSISWKSIEYKDARLMFQIRYSLDQYDIKDMEWTGPSGPDSYYMRSGEKISGIPEDARNLQYRAIFSYGNGCSSPKLSEVIIETIQKTGR